MLLFKPVNDFKPHSSLLFNMSALFMAKHLIFVKLFLIKSLESVYKNDQIAVLLSNILNGTKII